MKLADVQALPEGTKVYLLDFRVVAILGEVTAEVVECEVRRNTYDTAKHIARRHTWRGVETWRSVLAKWCYRKEYQAERELIHRVKVLREKLYTLETVRWKVDAPHTAPA